MADSWNFQSMCYCKKQRSIIFPIKIEKVKKKNPVEEISVKFECPENTWNFDAFPLKKSCIVGLNIVLNFFPLSIQFCAFMSLLLQIQIFRMKNPAIYIFFLTPDTVNLFSYSKFICWNKLFKCHTPKFQLAKKVIFLYQFMVLIQYF